MNSLPARLRSPENGLLAIVQGIVNTFTRPRDFPYHYDEEFKLLKLSSTLIFHTLVMYAYLNKATHVRFESSQVQNFQL